jgi:hypothetical protein
MPRLNERVSKLEGLHGARAYSPPVAALSTQLPAKGDEQEWMMQMLWQHGWHEWPGDCVLGLSVVAIDGEPGVLVPPTPMSALSMAQASAHDDARECFPRIEVMHFCGAEVEPADREADPYLAELEALGRKSRGFVLTTTGENPNAQTS